jgi:hypothetical protein
VSFVPLVALAVGALGLVIEHYVARSRRRHARRATLADRLRWYTLK